MRVWPGEEGKICKKSTMYLTSDLTAHIRSFFDQMVQILSAF